MKALIDGDLVELVGHYWIGKNGYAVHKSDQLVHRTIMEHLIGRKLVSPECVHHINYNKLDNRKKNLMLCANDKEHFLVHAKQDMINDGANPETDHYCTYHKAYHPKTEFSTVPSTWSGLHNTCRAATNQYRKENGMNKSKFDWKAMSNQQYRRARKSENIQISWLDKEGSRL